MCIRDSIMSALAQAATSMARLEGAGALDIRPLIAEAAEIAINGRRNGLKLSEIAAQDRLDADPDTRVILNLFASNANKVKPVAEALKRAADFAYSEANKPADDMFGAVSQADRGDVVSQIGPRDEARGAQNLEEPAGGKPAGRNAQGRAPEGPGQGNAGAAEEGASAGQAEGLTLKAESEADAQAKAKREADALAAEQQAKADEQARLKREANKREADARAAEILAEREAAKKAEVDAAADDFALGQEPPKPVNKKVAAEDLAGQKDIFGGAAPEEVVPAPQSLPDSVKTMLRWGLGRLNDARDALAGVERARGHGHTLAVEWKEQQQAIKEGRNKLAEIRGLADKNGMRATVEDYIREQGGEPDIERFNAAPAPAPEPAKRAPKSFRQSHKVTTSVFMEDTGTFSQQEVDADTALTALAADIEALNALRNCIAGV
jgi:hypothetical protein